MRRGMNMPTRNAVDRLAVDKRLSHQRGIATAARRIDSVVRSIVTRSLQTKGEVRLDRCQTGKSWGSAVRSHWWNRLCPRRTGNDLGMILPTWTNCAKLTFDTQVIRGMSDKLNRAGDPPALPGRQQ